MAQATANQIQVLGPVTATIDAVDLGHVLGASLKIPSSTVSGMTGRYGGASVKEFHDPQNPMLEIELAQVDLATYYKAIQAAGYATSAGNEVLTGGRSAGSSLTPVEIILTPISSDVSASRILKCWKCIPMGEPELIYKLEQQALKVTFKLIVDESKTEGEKFFKFGTVSVSADTSAPTVSSATPADGATGVATSVAPAITFDAALDESTVTGENGKANAFLVISGDTGTPAPIAATVTYNSATFIVTITPTSALSSSTAYDIMLTSGIKDASGNRFAGAKYGFTTA